ncbi:MAG TPA: UvrD-helicase domain-containing protein [Vicinamibacterales bacterium]
MTDLALGDQTTREQIASALDCNLLVEAGAGSGKTHEMAQRMAAGIAAGAYGVDGMAAVTFTRKAAAELRGRFQLALEVELAAERTRADSVREQRVRAALSRLERFFAGTIHSFCAHLLRERPVEAGVSPGFSELDEVEDAILRHQAWRDFVSQQVAAGHPLMLELREAGVRPRDLDDAFEVVTLYEEVEFPTGAAERPDGATAWAALDTFWNALQKKLPAAIPDETKCPTQTAARKFAGQLRVARARRQRLASLAELLETWDFTPKITQKWWSSDPAEKKRIRDAIDVLHSTFRDTVVTPFRTQWGQYLYRVAVALLVDARGFAARERRRRNVLSFADLLQLAARVLREDPGVRRALQRKYRWLFVDEFQDTDPVQAEIIFLLASADRDGSVHDWRDVPLRPGSLFVVGDPKQSIYRFRRADIDIYNIVARRLDTPPAGAVLALTTNFRSIPALCDWANRVFAQRFPPAPTTHSPRFAALKPARRRASGGHPHQGLFTLTVPGSCDQGDVCAAEAASVAAYIRAEVDAGRRTFGDFLLLTRKRKNLPVYAAALERLHVPIEVSGAGAFGESLHVPHLALLLRALTDPQDAVALVGVLRGPLFGISDPDLFAWRQAGGWFSVFSADAGGISSLSNVGAAFRRPESDSRVGDALASLQQYYRWIRVLPAGAALDRILEHSGLLALGATSPGGVEAGDLLHAVDRVRQVVADGQTLADAAQSLEDDLQASSEVESLPLEPGRTDVVRLMNLHKAKGLEAPAVFLADPCGGFRPRVDVRIIREGTAARGYFSLTTEWGKGRKVLAQPEGWDRYEAEEQAYLAAEEDRLLYVAATRARETLVVGRWASTGGRGTRAWAGLEPFLDTATELPVPTRVRVPSAQRVDMSAAAREAANRARAGAHTHARTASWSVASVTADARHVAKMTRAVEPASPDDPTRVVVRDTPSHRADAGAAWGALIHGLLEHAMRHEHTTRDDLRRLAMWLTVEEPQLRSVLDEALDTVQAVAAAAFWQEAQAAEHSVETPFAVADDRCAVLTGVIDLLFRTADGWRVMDYKTDVSPEAHAVAYQAQLAAYRRALESCGLHRVETRIVPIRIRDS